MTDITREQKIKWLRHAELSFSGAHIARAILADYKAQTPAIADIAAERRRQIEVEGWTAEHDDAHHLGEIARAAASYAYIGSIEEDFRNELPPIPTIVGRLWQWKWRWWKPTERRRDLVKAGALIIAEIERIDRAAIAAARGTK